MRQTLPILLGACVLLTVGCKKKPAAVTAKGGEVAVTPTKPGNRRVEEVLVVVNSHIITRRGFQQAVEQEHAALYRQFTGKELDEKLTAAREKTLQGLIDSSLIQDKAAELGIVVPDAYFRSNIDQIKKDNNFTSDADFERALKASLGVSMAEWMRRQKEQVLRDEVLRTEIFKKIAIEDQEIRAYYEDHKDEYKLPSRFRIRELVISKGVTEAEQAEAKAKVARLQAELKGGASFEELAKANSVSPSKDTGGDLGWMAKGLLRASLEEAAFKLKAGEVSQPVETDKDLILVQMVANEENRSQSFEEVKAKLLEKLQEPKAQNAIEQYLNGLRVRGNIRYMVPKEDILKG
ncbi:MAG TPA: peptidyl-prolyl cis-trans isomerase [Holophagaceae bacterium]|nr:peptidyl-prolyl cis-trans isomerase [Holophagaceae bacterium]